MTYGFEAFRSDGTALIRSTDGVARLIYSADIAEDYTGTISVSDFDSDLGFYTIRMYPFMHRIKSGTGYAPLAESSSWTQNGHVKICICQAYKPTLSWNNTTKQMSVTANSDTEDYYLQQIRYRYRLFMVHYK